MRGDPDVDALPCKQVSRSASEPLLLSLVNHKIHVLSVSTCAKLKRSVQLDLGHRKHGGTEKGGVISPLLSNISLHWFETCAMMVAKTTNQVMSIVRYADDFVTLAREMGGWICSADRKRTGKPVWTCGEKGEEKNSRHESRQVRAIVSRL